MYCRRNNLDLNNIIFVGNDINDSDVMRIVGYPICPLDAQKEIKQISSIVLDVKGGEGVARSIYNLISE